MRTQQQFLDEYLVSHRNHTNQLIHFVCVPLLYFAGGGLLWLIPIGRWLGFAPDVAYWVNGDTIFIVLASFFYFKMSMVSALAMMVWFAVIVVGIVMLQTAGLPLFWISLGLFIASFAVQIWGHKIEGKKPAFFNDLEFTLIGPLFVMHELRGKLR